MKREFKPLNDTLHITQNCKDYQTVKIAASASGRTDLNIQDEDRKRQKEVKKDRHSAGNSYVQELYREGRENDSSDSD